MRPQRRLGRRLEEVAKAVGGGCYRLPMPLTLALGVRGTVAGHRLGAQGVLSLLPLHPWRGGKRGGGKDMPSALHVEPGAWGSMGEARFSVFSPQTAR